MIHIFQFDDLGSPKDIEDFYRDFTYRLSDNSTDSIILDLKAIEFLTIEALLSLLCASKHWHSIKGTKVEWRASDSIIRYIERIDILQLFSDEIAVDRLPKDLLARGSSLSLMEIREISGDPEQNSHDVSNTIATSSSLLMGRISTKQLGGISTLLSEVIQNVTHSQVVGHSFMQIYDIGNKNRVHIGVVDTGLGIESSLSIKYPNLHNASEYINRG